MPIEKQTSVMRPAMSKWRERLWPIYPEEMKKFLPMVIMMFCVLFTYTVVRNIKDSLLVNAPYSSSSALPWAKIGIVSPMTILFVLFYAKLSNIFSREKLFYTCLIPFIIYFALFGFWIYPNHHLLNASPETILQWKDSVPAFIEDAVPVIGYWTFSMYYMMAELWGNIGVALLFWQFANQITPTEEAKRFYPMFGFWSNLGLICAGLLTQYGDQIMKAPLLPTGEKDFTQPVMLYSGCVMLGCMIVGLVYWWMGRNVLTDPRYYSEAAVAKKGKKADKPKLSIKESIKFLMNSKYLGYITVLVLAYGITINLVEVMWKDEVKLFFKGDKNAYSAFIGQTFMYTGIATMILIFLSKNMVKSLGWLFSASVTPWVMLVTSIIFLTFMIFRDYTAPLCAVLGTTPLAVSVWAGFAQNTLSKGTKYALFDPTKEMAYIPLDEESKVKGKAAIDVIGGRFGKSGGSVIQIMVKGLLKSIGAKVLIVPALGSILVGFSLWWLWAVKKLSAAYQRKLEEKEREATIL